jgi:dihydroorotate dehydrogenase
MSWLYRHLLRPALFAQDAEEIHHRTLRGLSWAAKRDWVCEALQSWFGAPSLPIGVFGLNFPNPVGLAAGMDKNAEALPAWAALGFGYTELGAVTWHPQPGNPPPRVFRAIPDEAIINRMGFNNEGTEAVGRKLAEWRNAGRWPSHPVGMNLGKSKITPLESAAEDYAKSLQTLISQLDFFVVNVSSPNTPNLRQLQDKAALDHVLSAVLAVREQPVAPVMSRNQNSLGSSAPPHPSTARVHKPILVKVALDLSFEALDEVLDLAVSRGVDGIVATNTTISRPASTSPQLQSIYSETGGLSGLPLKARSTEVIGHIYKRTGKKLPIIGVGGIFNAADAWEKITAGASLVQVYTGLVYEGPGIARDVVTGLVGIMERFGVTRLMDAIGAEVK